MAAIGTGVLFVLLVLPSMFPTAMPDAIASIDAIANMSTPLAIGVFLAATAVWLLMIYIVTAVLMMRRRTNRA